VISDGVDVSKSGCHIFKEEENVDSCFRRNDERDRFLIYKV
jgi:hypothetical protein